MPSAEAATRLVTLQREPSFTAGGVFLLPGGYAEGGRVFREVELSPVNGAVEEAVAAAGASALASALVTRLLAGCVRRVGDLRRPGVGVVRGLLVGDRDFLVVKLRQLTVGDKVDLRFFCPRPGCGKVMDLSFQLSDLPVEERPVTGGPYRVDTPGGPDVLFRLPDGGDQEALAPMADDPRAGDLLLTRCVLRIGDVERPDLDAVAALPGAVRARVEDEMARLAPEVSAEVEAVCPECGGPFSQALDLLALFLAELLGGGGALEREVHFLALHYHWSEREILRLTRPKRRRYVDLLAEELDRSRES